jgi:hypothetical protein
MIGVESFTRQPSNNNIQQHDIFPFRKIAIRGPNGCYLKAMGGGKGNWYMDMFLFKYPFWTGNLFIKFCT